MKNKKAIMIAAITSSILAISCADNSHQSYANLSKENVTTTEASAITSNIVSASDSASVPNIASSNTDNRITVHKGNIETQTADAKKYVSLLVATINNLGGHTSNYQLSTNEYEKTTQDFSTDSMYKVIEQTTTATLMMRIPVNRADSFVQQIMHMDGTIIHLQLHEEDKTTDYQIADGVDKFITDKPKQINNFGVENAIQNRVQKNEITYQAKYFWCDVMINGDAQIIKKALLKPSAYRTPFYLNAWHATQEGFYILGNVLIGILYILPIGLLVVGIVLVVRKGFKYRFNSSKY
jgi:hypothetical protein